MLHCRNIPTTALHSALSIGPLFLLMVKPPSRPTANRILRESQVHILAAVVQLLGAIIIVIMMRLLASLFLPDDIGADAFVYDDECQLVRPALWLCEVADVYHANYFAQAGITTFARLAELAHRSWNKLQIRLARNRTFTVAHDHQIKSLTAISLWVNTKIVHGSFNDVNSLSIQDVQAIVHREVCVDVLHPAVKPNKLAQQSDYPMWKKQMRLHWSRS